ncbi:hypothetical protein VOLCADRAFT_107970 [Volvox carteri f. nagariensis]|uniref:Uncharacterized protein n=1 Tax=Volvox carteri f. nagariensis TaxID=3068 RepID=D8UHI4_VOLCA|nr:uncharacterized protein VOLCADRAFT_107970 [Volvox carteri f. nagariensis]EFJ40857.1 hypothetical protein VOLCADRAFT_107970 [Volvox carteri f. nagariensis]|eukprot:XP_002958126.1 hypothetical protein VOLCADRAFT_107970 [Volvox carteri f. nagariensis]
MVPTMNCVVKGQPFVCRRMPSRNFAGSRLVLQATSAVSTAARPTEDLRPAEYAVISTPTGQHLVEEGKWFALSSEGALKASSGSGQLRFPALAVKRADGEFVKGKPFLSDWVVEAELIDEQAFALQASSNPTGPSNLLGKVLVTKITHTDETRRRIEDAFRA